MSETIYFNGKRYNSVAEMPSSVRRNYEKFNRIFTDANQDGIPDLVQSGGLSGFKETFNVIKDVAQLSTTEGFTQEQLSIVRVSDTSIFVNGKEYNSVEEMPDYVREEFERTVNIAQDGRSDIYDEAWREVDRDEYFKPHDDEILNQRIGNQASRYNAPIETVDSNNRFILIAAIAIMIIGCMAAVWFLVSNFSL
jgi:hypothetical protein